MLRIRRPALVLSIIIHTLLAVLLLWLWTGPRPRSEESALKTFALAGPRGAPAPTPRRAVVVSPLPPRFESPIEASPPDTASAGGGGGVACPVAANIQAALMADPAALAELAALSPADRSVASAIVLWPGPQVTDAAQSPPTIPILPKTGLVIVSQLQSLPPDCLDGAQAGPEFIYIESQNETTLTASLGSGTWRWRELLDNLTLAMKLSRQ